MSINLTNLAKTTITATDISDLILITPNKNKGYRPQDNETKITGIFSEEAFLFDYEGEQSMSLASDITDHYVEDNTVINDQIALKQEEFTVNGYVGELNDVVPPELEPLKIAADRLTNIAGYVPEISETALIAYNTAKFLYDSAISIAQNTVNTWATLTTGAALKTKQEIAFLKFYGYWRDRRLFTIQTPWALFSDMVIKNMRINQPSDDRMTSDFEITFKKMRFAKIKVINASSTLGENMSDRTDTASKDVQNFGVQTPVESDSFATKFNSFLENR